MLPFGVGGLVNIQEWLPEKNIYCLLASYPLYYQPKAIRLGYISQSQCFLVIGGPNGIELLKFDIEKAQVIVANSNQ